MLHIWVVSRLLLQGKLPAKGAMHELIYCYGAVRFNTGPDQVENTIVTSSGNYIIAWDFNRVKGNKKDRYNIKQ